MRLSIVFVLITYFYFWKFKGDGGATPWPPSGSGNALNLFIYYDFFSLQEDIRGDNE